MRSRKSEKVHEMVDLCSKTEDWRQGMVFERADGREANKINCDHVGLLYRVNFLELLVIYHNTINRRHTHHNLLIPTSHFYFPTPVSIKNAHPSSTWLQSESNWFKFLLRISGAVHQQISAQPQQTRRSLAIYYKRTSRSIRRSSKFKFTMLCIVLIRRCLRATLPLILR